MLIIAAVGKLAHQSFVAGNAGFLISLLLACTAFLQLLWSRFLLRIREAQLPGVLIFFFVIDYAGHWMRSLKPASPYRGFDFSAYDLAAKVPREMPQHDLHVLPLTPDTHAALNAESPFFWRFGKR